MSVSQEAKARRLNLSDAELLRVNWLYERYWIAEVDEEDPVERAELLALLDKASAPAKRRHVQDIALREISDQRERHAKLVAAARELVDAVEKERHLQANAPPNYRGFAEWQDWRNRWQAAVEAIATVLAALRALLAEEPLPVTAEIGTAP